MIDQHQHQHQHHHHHHHHHHRNNQQQQANAKCDQVIFEAILKFSQCIICSRTKTIHKHNNPNINNNTCNGTNHHQHRHNNSPRPPAHKSHHPTHTSSSNHMRAFHLDLDDGILEEVRGMLLQQYPLLELSKTNNNNDMQLNGNLGISVPSSSSSSSVHTAVNVLNSKVHIDVFYADRPFEDSSIDVNAADNSDSYDLLERWVVEYSTEGECANEALRNNNLNGSDLLSMLRLICKRVVILLRSVYCFARMLPAQRLHQRLNCDTEGVTSISNHSPQNGFYYSSIHDQNNTTSLSTRSNGESIQVGCSVLPSEASNTGDSQLMESFIKHQFSSVSTPFGSMKISVLYSADGGGHVPRHNIPISSQQQHQSKPTRQQQEAFISSTPPTNILSQNTQSDSENTQITQNQSGSMTKKTMSGLSLALMNDCNISRTPNYSGTPPTGPQYAMRSGDAGRISFNSSKNPSPRSLSSTPPFGASPGVLSGLSFPTTISSTPPFRMGSYGSNRESIYIPPGTTLLPPASLERLPESPFKALEMRNGEPASFEQSSLPMAIPLPTGIEKTHDSGNIIEPPFVGSFPCASPAFESFNRLSSKSIYASTSVREDCDDDNFPFAVDSCNPSSENSSSMSFTQRYAAPQRLHLFDSVKSLPGGERRTLLNSQRRNSAGGNQNISDQLAEFHNFSASLSQVNGAAGHS